MAAEALGIDLLPVVALLSAATVAALVFQRLGLGSVLGYLATVDFQIRETFESALCFGQRAIELMGAAPAEIAEFTVRSR